MKSLIITVAGMSSRFNRDMDVEVLKCLYHEGSAENSMLFQQVRKTYDLVEEIVVVGGYRYDDLVAFVQKEMGDYLPKIKLVYNEHFHDYGSCYSLLKGIELVSQNTDEIVFIEGDLFFASESVEAVINSKRDVISVNDEPILSNKAVALYFDVNNCPHYIYDTNHSYLEIREPFTAIYNSAQMWKFHDAEKLFRECDALTQQQKEGTNLEIVQRYFGNINMDYLEIVTVNEWFNCNTKEEYLRAISFKDLKR